MDRNCKMNNAKCLLKGNQPQNVRIHFKLKPEDNLVHLGVDTMRLIDEKSSICGSKRQLEKKKIRFQGFSTTFQQAAPPLSPAGEAAASRKSHEEAIHTALVGIAQGTVISGEIKTKEIQRSQPLSRKRSGPQKVSDKISIQMKEVTKITSIARKFSVVALPRHSSKKSSVKITSKKSSIMLAKRQVEKSSPSKRRKGKSKKENLSDKHSKIKIEQDEDLAIKKETMEKQESTYLMENHNLPRMVKEEGINESEENVVKLQATTTNKNQPAPHYKSSHRRPSVKNEAARHDNVSAIVGVKDKGRAKYLGSQDDKKSKEKVGTSKRKSRGRDVAAREMNVTVGKSVNTEESFTIAVREENENFPAEISDANIFVKPRSTETSKQHQVFLDDSNSKQSGTGMPQTSAVTSPYHLTPGGHSKDDVLKRDSEVKVYGVPSSKSSLRESRLKTEKLQNDFKSKSSFNSSLVETAVESDLKDDGSEVAKSVEKFEDGIKKSSSVGVIFETINTASIVEKPSEKIANDVELKSVDEIKNLVTPALQHFTADVENNLKTSAASISPPSETVGKSSIAIKIPLSISTHDRTSSNSSPSESTTIKEINKSPAPTSDNETQKYNISTPNKKMKRSLTPDSKLKKSYKTRKSLTSTPDNEVRKPVLTQDSELKKITPAASVMHLNADTENNLAIITTSISPSNKIADELSTLRRRSSSVSKHDRTSSSSSYSTKYKEINKSPVQSLDQTNISTPSKKMKRSLTPDSKLKKSTTDNDVRLSVLTQESELKKSLASNPDNKVSHTATSYNETNKSSILTPVSALNVSASDNEVHRYLQTSEQKNIYKVSGTQHKLSDVSEEDEILQHKNERETDSKSQTKSSDISETNATVNAVESPSNENLQFLQSSEKKVSEFEILNYSEQSDDRPSSTWTDSKVDSMDTSDVATESLSTQFYEEKNSEKIRTGKVPRASIEEFRKSKNKSDTSLKELTENTRDRTPKMISPVSPATRSPISALFSSHGKKHEDETTVKYCSRVTDESELQLDEAKEIDREMSTETKEQEEAAEQRDNEEIIENKMEIDVYDESKENMAHFDENVIKKQIDDSQIQTPVTDKKVNEIIMHREVKEGQVEIERKLTEVKDKQLYIGKMKENDEKDSEVMSVSETEEKSCEQEVMEIQKDAVTENEREILKVEPKNVEEDTEVTTTLQEVVELQTLDRADNAETQVTYIQPEVTDTKHVEEVTELVTTEQEIMGIRRKTITVNETEITSIQQKARDTEKAGPKNEEVTEVTTPQQEIVEMQTEVRPTNENEVIFSQPEVFETLKVEPENAEEVTEVTIIQQDGTETQMLENVENEDTQFTAIQQEVIATHKVEPENVEVTSSQQVVIATQTLDKAENEETGTQEKVINSQSIVLYENEETQVTSRHQEAIETQKVGTENIEQEIVQLQTNVDSERNFTSTQQSEVSDVRREIYVKSWPRRALCSCVYLVRTLWLTLLLLGLLGYHYVDICALYQAQIVQWALLMLHLAYRLGLETADEQPNLIRIVTLEIFWFLLGIYVSTLVAMNEIVLAPLYYVYAFFVRS